MGGTSRAQFRVCQNKKRQYVHTISYMREYGQVPLNLLRLQDYLVYNQSRQNINAKAANSLDRFMAKVAGAAGATHPAVNLGANMGANLGANLGMGSQFNSNPNSNLTGMNQQKSLFNNQQPGMNSGYNNFNKTGGMFNQTNKPTGMGMGAGANFNMGGSRNIPLPGGQNTNTGLFNNNLQRQGGMMGQMGMQNQQKTSMFPSMGNNTGASGLFNKPAMGTNTMGQSTLFTKNNQGATSMFQANNMNRQNTMGAQTGLFNQNKQMGAGGMFNNQNKPGTLFNTGNQMKPNQTTSTLFSSGNTGTGASALFQSKPNTTGASSLFNTGMGANKPGAMTGTGLFNKPLNQTTGVFNTNKTGNVFQNAGNSNNLFNRPQMLNQNQNNQQFNQMGSGQQNQMMMPMMNPAMNGGYAMVCVPLANNNGNPTQAPNVTSTTQNPMNNTNNNQLSVALQKLLKSSGYNMGVDTRANSQDSVNSILEQFKKFDSNHYHQHQHDVERDSFYDSVLSTASREGPIVQKSNETSYLRAKANAQKVLRGMRRRKRVTPGSKSLKSSYLQKESDMMAGKWTTERKRKISKKLNEDEPGKILSSSIRQSNLNHLSAGPTYAPQAGVGMALSTVGRDTQPNPHEIAEIKNNQAFKKKPTPANLRNQRPLELQVILEKFGKDSKFKFKLNSNDLVSSILTTAQHRKLLNPEELATTMVIFNNKPLDLTGALVTQGLKPGASNSQTVYLYPKGSMERYFADTRIVPILERPDYQCNPTIIDLSRMTEEELQAVEKFEISNEHGKIVFESPVDLRSANLDKIVTIEHKFVEVYGKNSGPKPPAGSGLNVCALVTYYGYRRKGHVPIDRFVKTLKRQAKKIKAEFIDYNEKKEELMITVKNF